MRRIYLDHNATCPLQPAARRALLDCLDATGLANPSSVHQEGRQARARLDQARASLARSLDCERDEIVFTSGGTEANALVLSAVPATAPILVTPIEHPSLLVPLRDRAAVHLLALDRLGRVEPSGFAAALAAGAGLVSVGRANNEQGVLQDLADLARQAHAAGALVHTDACQALGKIPLSFRELGVDLMTVAAHKLGGPVGVGALVVRKGVHLEPMLLGGEQEGGLRAGTEACALAASFAAAARQALERLPARARIWRRWCQRLLEQVLELEPEARINSPEGEDEGLPNTLNVSFPGRPAAVVVQGLDLEGVSISQGSACASGASQASPVLLALGLSAERASTSVRISVGPENRDRDMDDFGPRLARVLRQVAPRALV